MSIPAGYRRRGFVYAIRDDAAQSIKIGFSINPMQRLRQLQTGHASRLRLVCLFQNVQAFESSLHDWFANRRLVGEWFDDKDGSVSSLLALASGEAAE